MVQRTRTNDAIDELAFKHFTAPVQLELDLLSPHQKELKDAYYAGYMDGHRDASNRKGKTEHFGYSRWANRPPT